MRRNGVKLVTVLALTLAGSSARAQTGLGGGTGGTAGLGNLTTGIGGGTGGGIGGLGGGSGGGTSGQASGMGFSGGVDPIAGGASVTGIVGGSGTNGPSSIISSSNPLGSSFANPLFQGRIGSTLEAVPGGFGQVLYSSTTAGGRAGTAGIGGVPGGRTAGATGVGTATASRSTASTAAALPRPNIRYSISLKNAPSMLMPPARMQAELLAMLGRSSAIRNAANVTVSVEEGSNVILTGRVADDEERRLVEGMVRLTPGVRGIDNRLEAVTLPPPTP